MISHYHALHINTSLHTFTTEYINVFNNKVPIPTVIPTDEFAADFAEDFSKMRKECAKNKSMTPQTYYDENFLRSTNFQTKLTSHCYALVNYRRFFQFWNEKYMKLIGKTTRCLVVARPTNLTAKVKLSVVSVIPYAIEDSDLDSNMVYYQK